MPEHGDPWLGVRVPGSGTMGLCSSMGVLLGWSLHVHHGVLCDKVLAVLCDKVLAVQGQAPETQVLGLVWGT